MSDDLQRSLYLLRAEELRELAVRLKHTQPETVIAMALGYERLASGQEHRSGGLPCEPDDQG